MLHKLLNYTLKCNNADFIGVTRSFEGAKFELLDIISKKGPLRIWKRTFLLLFARGNEDKQRQGNSHSYRFPPLLPGNISTGSSSHPFGESCSRRATRFPVESPVPSAFPQSASIAFAAFKADIGLFSCFVS